LLIPGRAPYDGVTIFRGGMPAIRLMFSCEPIFRRDWTGREVGPELANPLDGGRPRPAEWSEWLELEFDSVASPCSSF
jgi:hypothetical protein